MSGVSATEVAEWLKTTVPGILILGALGSVAAYLVVELGKYVGKRLFLSAARRAREAGKRALASALRPFARSFALATRYSGAKDHSRLTVWAVSSYVSFAVTLALFVASLCSTIAVAISLGLIQPLLLAFLVGVTGFVGIFLVQAFADVLAVHVVLFGPDVEEIDEHLKDDDGVIFLSAFVVAFDTAMKEYKQKAAESELKDVKTTDVEDSSG